MGTYHKSIDILKEVVLSIEILAEKTTDEDRKLFLQSTANQYKDIVDRLRDNDYECACSLLSILDAEQKSFAHHPTLLELFSSCLIHGW